MRMAVSVSGGHRSSRRACGWRYRHQSSLCFCFNAFTRVVGAAAFMPRRPSPTSLPGQLRVAIGRHDCGHEPPTVANARPRQISVCVGSIDGKQKRNDGTSLCTRRSLPGSSGRRRKRPLPMAPGSQYPRRRPKSRERARVVRP
jgi:hypothetical protein